MGAAPLPAYLVALLAAIEAGAIVVEPGAAVHVEVAHDDDCKLLSGRGACDCSPEVKVVRR